MIIIIIIIRKEPKIIYGSEIEGANYFLRTEQKDHPSLGLRGGIIKSSWSNFF